MKKTLIFVFLIITAVFTFAQEISDLGITGEYYDIRSDTTGTIHILWRDGGWMKYGQIVNRQVVNQETISVLDWGEVNYRKFRPRLSVRPDGSSVHFTWVTPASNPRTLRHCWRNASGSWAVEDVYTSSTRYLEYPALTVDGTGMVHATVMSWVSSNDLHPVHYFRKPVGGGWTQESNLAAANAKHLWCTLYTDTSGNVHATWDRNKQAVQYRYAASGGNLANSSTVTLPTSWDRNKESEVAVDSQGNVHVTAMAYDDPGQYVGYDYWFKPAGGSFGNPIRATDIDFRVENYFPNPAILGETRNMVVVSWAEPAGGYHQNADTIRVGFFNGTTWDHMTLDTTADLKEWSRTTMANNSTTSYMVWRNGGDTLSLATFDFATTGILSPNGGESWLRNNTYEIKWNLENATGNVDIHLYKNDSDLGPIVSDIADSGSYSWTINTLESGAKIVVGNDYKVEVKASNGSDSDISASDFTIDSIMQVTSPTSADTWEAGQSYNITWEYPAGSSSNIKINVFKDSISTENFIEQLAGPNNGTYSWTIPSTYQDGNYILRIKTDDGTHIADSDVFAIVTDPTAPAAITVVNPASGVTWYRGATYSINWNKSGSQSSIVNIYVYYGSIDPGNLQSQMTVSNSGSYSWAIPGTHTVGNHIIRIQTDDTEVTGDSGTFTIAYNPGLTPTLTITSPDSGDNWSAGETYDITWERTGTQNSQVKINVFRNSISAANFVEQFITSNTGTYNWTIPASYVSGDYILRIKTYDNLVMDDSDVFQISEGGAPEPPSITVISPASCSMWHKDQTYMITWLKTGTQSENVKVNIFKDSIDPTNFVEQLTGPNTGTISWPVSTLLENGNYILRIKTDDNQVIGDSSLFALDSTPVSSPKITVTSPVSCDTWTKLTTYKIAWSVNGAMSDNVKVNIFKDSIDPANFVEQLTGPNTGTIDWTIPGTYVNGNYIIRIKTDDNAVVGDSELFAVTD